MKSFTKFLVCVILAFGSFAYARYHYVELHSVTITNPFNKSQFSTVGRHFFAKDFFGDWIKDEWLFAIAVPALLLGAALTPTRKSNAQMMRS
jgi:hypothetical protein